VGGKALCFVLWTFFTASCFVLWTFMTHVCDACRAVQDVEKPLGLVSRGVRRAHAVAAACCFATRSKISWQRLLEF
jgi:hypothetical protein